MWLKEESIKRYLVLRIDKRLIVIKRRKKSVEWEVTSYTSFRKKDVHSLPT